MKKILSLVLVLIMALSMLTACGEKEPAELPYTPTQHNDLSVEYTSLSAEELNKNLRIGWNLGNTLDAPDGENSWGQPTTTPEMMAALKDLGFNLIRVPVSWHKHMDKENVIDEEWMDRVQEIVDYAISLDMYVIINSHHDNDQYYPSKRIFESSGEEWFRAVWTQVAERFKDYDQHLIFEAMNEPRLSGTNHEWWCDTNSAECLEAVDIINKNNQIFVDAVRASGGRNTDRILMMSCYCGNGDYAAFEHFVIPTDTVEDRLMLSYHAYTPYNLAMGTDPNVTQFDANGEKEVNWVFQKIKAKFLDAGIPAVVTEMGCINKGNDFERYKWGKYYISKGKEYGVTCVWWDNQHNSFGEETYALFDRTNLKIFDECQEVYRGMMEGLE